MEEFIDQLINGLSVGCIYALIALGYTMVYGIIKLINFAHGEFFMVGAFIGYFALALASGTGNFILALALAMAGAAVLAVVVEKVAYKPLRRSTRIAALLTALGVSLFLQNVGIKVLGADPRGFPVPFENTNLKRADHDYWYSVTEPRNKTGRMRTREVPLFFEGEDIDENAIARAEYDGADRAYRYYAFKINTKQIIVFVTVIILMVGLQVLIHHTRMGKAMRAVSFDKTTSELMGINVDRVISFTFFVGGALGGAAGLLYGIYYGKVDPMIGFLPGLKAFIAAVVGGIGSIPGAVIGGLVMGVSENMAVGYSGRSEYRDAIAFGILILILLIKPSGILGSRVKEKV